MSVTAQHYEPTAELARLRPHPRNPRRGDDEQVARSIGANGFYGAIIAQRSTGYVLAGHTRLRALQAGGTTTGPVLWVDADDATATRILLADNQTALLASWDDRALAELLEDLSLSGGAEALQGTGFDAEAMADLLADLSLDETPASPVDPELAKAESLAAYQATDLRQIVLVYDRATYERVTARLATLREGYGVTSFAAVVARLLVADADPDVGPEPEPEPESVRVAG